MKKLVVFSLLLFVFAAAAAKKKPRVLLFYKTAGFYHKSIETALPALYKLGRENGIDVDSTKDSELFTAANLKRYNAIVFLSTTGKLFNNRQKNALKDYVNGGGGIAGIHAATDAEYGWPWYNRMMGAWFLSHPKQQDATLHIIDKSHLSTEPLPEKWTRYDEWYDFKEINKDIKTLITIDERTYEGGKNGDFHPVAWYHNFEGGRVFYTALGHTDASFSDPLFLKHVLGGIQYAIGVNQKIK